MYADFPPRMGLPEIVLATAVTGFMYAGLNAEEFKRTLGDLKSGMGRRAHEDISKHVSGTSLGERVYYLIHTPGRQLAYWVHSNKM